MSLTRS